MKNMKFELNDNTRKLNKIDYIIMGIMVLLYAIISFYQLGDTVSPKTFYTFNNIDDSVVINLDNNSDILKMRYYTGNNIGELDILVSNDNKKYTHLKEFKTKSVLAWEDIYLYTDAKSLKFVSKSENVTLGDIALYDYSGKRINIAVDKNNPMLDETDLVPIVISYMNSTYFDEIYHARSAYEYVNGIDTYEWTHPPLGKLIMSLPVLIFGYSPFTVRLMGNIAGILLIPIMYVLCKKVFKNRKYALLGAILMMFDNMHFVHTRIALVDSFEVLFILLSVIFMVNYLSLKKNDKFKEKRNNLLLSGFFIGCAIATKWNALYAGLGLAIVFFVHLARQYDFNPLKHIKKAFNLNNAIRFLLGFVFIPLSLRYLVSLYTSKSVSNTLLTIYLVLLAIYLLYKLIRLIIKNKALIIKSLRSLIKDRYLFNLFIICVISFIIVPLIVYILSYILFPNVDYYDGTLGGIVDQTKLMYDYHANLVATHPFSSKWFEWPIMYKPVWFYSGEVINNTRDTIVDIGNPAIWWFGIVSFVYLVISTIKKNKESLLILIFILASFVPYVFIGRVMFIYHYFITLPFVMMGIVAFIKWLVEKYKSDKVYISYIILVVLMFFIFYPVAAGMRVGEDYINSLKWLSSWHF